MSCDAFSGFGVHNRVEHNAEVRDATHHLLMKTIPEFAAALCAHKVAPITRRQVDEESDVV